ncbi:MAG: diphosphomevalonate decarboxylase [Verrucomicrobia bacterium]|jgi:diphosphomevalonate decarboxylase|nr:diphosphomevalonate decarboxylase [Verrucomicrobiota bacterium]
MNPKQEVVNHILAHRTESPMTEADAFAPANIALCKYWGKRDTELNLPVTSSLSLSLGSLGSQCHLSFCEERHQVVLNDEPLDPNSPFVVRLSQYLDLFRRDTDRYYRVETLNTIPTAAGFASSASGFASTVLALDKLHGWCLSEIELSILARLGSGSACRSLWQGFVEWHAGETETGMDCFAQPITTAWPELRIGLLVLEAGKKPIGSREAMQRTVETSPLYASWPHKVAADIQIIRKAIEENNFEALGAAAESNALTMHATMMGATPAVVYWLPESVETMHRVWKLRREGLPLYFTMDAGPNVKLLFLDKDRQHVEEHFPDLLVAQ